MAEVGPEARRYTLLHRDPRADTTWERRICALLFEFGVNEPCGHDPVC